MEKGYDGFDGVELVVNGGGGTGQVVDLINLQEEWLNDVMSDELEPRVSKMVHHVLFPPCEKIIHHNHAVSSPNQPVHQVAPHETSSPGNHYPQPLPLQPQRHLPPRIHKPKPSAAVPGVRHPVSQLGRRLRGEVGVRDRVEPVGVRSRRRWEEEEHHGGDSNADEREKKALLAKHVANWTNHGKPRLGGFRRVPISHGLRFVASEYQLRPHFSQLLQSNNTTKKE